MPTMRVLYPAWLLLALNSNFNDFLISMLPSPSSIILVSLPLMFEVQPMEPYFASYFYEIFL